MVMSQRPTFVCDHCHRTRDSFFLMDFRAVLDDPRSDSVDVCVACCNARHDQAYWLGWLDSLKGTPWDEI